MNVGKAANGEHIPVASTLMAELHVLILRDKNML
jgi:hypothetical protein